MTNYTPTLGEVKQKASTLRFPTLAWVRSQLRNNLVCPLRVEVFEAVVVGSVAKSCPDESSDLDIAVIIPAKRRVSALQFSERYHQKLGLRGGSQPVFSRQEGRLSVLLPCRHDISGLQQSPPALIAHHMVSQNPNSLEKVGVGLACSVETFRGCNIQLVKKISGFNGLSTNKDGHVRKIEVKSMETNYKWIAISGLVAIDKLFFERDYWIYFVLLPQNYVVMTKGLPFVRRQLSLSANTDYVDALQDWMKATRRLTKQSGLKFLPKLQLKFPVGLDEIVKQLATNPTDTSWRGSVVEIWQNKGSWVNLYREPDED